MLTCLLVMLNNKSLNNTQDPFLIFLADTDIDDCLGTASCTRVDLERFITYVNGFHHALKFTWEISETCSAVPGYFDID